MPTALSQAPTDAPAAGGPASRGSTVQAVARLDDPGVRALLDRAAAGDLFAQGRVNIVDLQAVRRRLGARWDLKREQVWDQAQKTLERRLTPGDHAVRLSETEFLVCVTSASGPAAQLACLQSLGEVLHHYFGEADPADLTVKTALSFSGDRLDCAPVDPLTRPPEPRAVPAPTPPSQAPQSSQAARAAVASALRRRAMAISSPSQAMWLDYELAPMINLRQGVPAAHHLSPRVYGGSPLRVFGFAELLRLDTSTLARIDIQTAELVQDLIAERALADPPVLIASLALQTLSYSTSRAQVLNLLAELPVAARGQLVLELVNLGEGAPICRISECVGLVSAFCRAVVAAIPPTRAALAGLREARVAGVVVDGRAFDSCPRKLVEGMAAYVEHAREAAPMIAVANLPSAAAMQVAKRVGVTHAGLAQPPMVSLPLDPQRVTH